ncbi:MAG: nucleotidyltransferase family protein [Pseudomonadota bacterium]
MSGLTAFILAGSRGPDDPMAVATGSAHKALILVGGTPMLLRVIAALAATPEVARLVVCIEAPQLVRELPGLDAACNSKPLELFAAQGSPSRSVSAALAHYGTPLLVTTADHALLQAEWVSHFLQHQPAGVDATVALARSEVVMAAAPDTRRTFLRFADGHYSGCNLFYFASPRAAALATLWVQVEALRKQPLKMLGLLGFGYALRYRFGWLKLGSALARLGVLAGGVRAAVVEMPFGRAAIDVDKMADLELVQRLLKG